MSRIVIIGGHGKVALELSPILVGAGHEVTSLFRNPDHSDEVGETGATPVVLDVEASSAGEIAERIEGHDAVVWSAGAGGGNPRRTFTVDRDAAIRSMDAGERAGVLRYVMVSYLGSSTDHGVAEDNPFFAYAESKAAADRYLRGTDLSWTILGPGRLTQEKASGRIELDPDKGAVRRDTSRGNVARVAAAALADPGSIGKTIDFIDGDTPIEEAVGAAK